MAKTNLLCFFFFHWQYFEDSNITEKKMIQLVDRLNTEYDVQNITSRESAEQALERLTVSSIFRARDFWSTFVQT